MNRTCQWHTFYTASSGHEASLGSLWYYPVQWAQSATGRGIHTAPARFTSINIAKSSIIITDLDQTYHESFTSKTSITPLSFLDPVVVVVLVRLTLFQILQIVPGWNLANMHHLSESDFLSQFQNGGTGTDVTSCRKVLPSGDCIQLWLMSSVAYAAASAGCLLAILSTELSTQNASRHFHCTLVL